MNKKTVSVKQVYNDTLHLYSEWQTCINPSLFGFSVLHKSTSECVLRAQHWEHDANEGTHHFLPLRKPEANGKKPACPLLMTSDMLLSGRIELAWSHWCRELTQGLRWKVRHWHYALGVTLTKLVNWTLQVAEFVYLKQNVIYSNVSGLA